MKMMHASWLFSLGGGGCVVFHTYYVQSNKLTVTLMKLLQWPK